MSMPVLTLLRCPLCGDRATVAKLEDCFGVTCDTDDCIDGPPASTPEGAAARWNQRASGCARDQRTTQGCAVAAESQAIHAAYTELLRLPATTDWIGLCAALENKGYQRAMTLLTQRRDVVISLQNNRRTWFGFRPTAEDALDHAIEELNDALSMLKKWQNPVQER